MKRQYDKEFKMDAAKLVVETGKTAAQVARDMGIAEQT
ncbi:transposase, partial [Sporosarcina contaminans]